MKKTAFLLKKWWARAFVTVGAALGLSACFHTKNNPSEPVECVYGPPPGYDPKIEVIEDVYGPPPMDTVEVNTEADTVAEPVVLPKKTGVTPKNR